MTTNNKNKECASFLLLHVSYVHKQINNFYDDLLHNTLHLETTLLLELRCSSLVLSRNSSLTASAAQAANAAENTDRYCGNQC